MPVKQDYSEKNICETDTCRVKADVLGLTVPSALNAPPDANLWHYAFQNLVLDVS